jgi:hypothetical protein
MFVVWAVNLYLAVYEPNPTIFHIRGSILIIMGLLFFALHGNNIINWKIYIYILIRPIGGSIEAIS